MYSHLQQEQSLEAVDHDLAKTERAENPAGATVRNADQSTSSHLRTPEPRTTLQETQAADDEHDRSERRILELELMHLYSTLTYQSCVGMSSQAVTTELWQRFVPRQSWNHPFLLHGILAFAALHMAKMKQSPENADVDVSLLQFSYSSSSSFYFRKALEYQNMAFSSFHSVLQDVTQENCHAVFAFSVLTMILAIAIPQQSTCDQSVAHMTAGDNNLKFDSNNGPVSSLTPLQSIFTLFEFLKGVGSIVQLSRPWLRAGPFHLLLDKHMEYREKGGRWQSIDPDVLEELHKLKELNERLHAPSLPHCLNSDSNQVTAHSSASTFSIIEPNNAAISHLEFAFAGINAPTQSPTSVSTPLSDSLSVDTSVSTTASSTMTSTPRLTLGSGSMSQTPSVPTISVSGEEGRDQDRGHIIGWLAKAGRDYISLLRDGNPVSLLIFLHWAVLLAAMDDVAIFWWSRGSSKALVGDISQILHSRGPEWVQRTEWVRRKVGLA